MINREQQMIEQVSEEPSLIFKFIKDGEFEVIEKMVKENLVDVNLVDSLGNDVVTRLLKVREYDLVITLMKKRNWDVNHQNVDGNTFGHILALDNGGLNEPWNVVPLRKGYNTSKRNNENTLNWYMEQEYFSEERLQRIIEWQVYAYEKWGGEEFGELVFITDLFEEEE